MASTRQGSVLLTGANGSLALPAISHLLTNYPNLNLILTVRNTDPLRDSNTARLHEIISAHPAPVQSRVSIHALDLSSLSSVSSFASTIASDISLQKTPPLISIICNAYHWNLVASSPEITADGFEKTFQINHLSHASLVLRLLGSGSFGPEGGRIVLFSSDAHWPGKNAFERYPPTLGSSLEDLEQLVKPRPTNLDEKLEKAEKDHMGRGFQRYANSKLAITTWMYALNAHLETSPKPTHKSISTIALNPGSLVDSRATRTNTPLAVSLLGRLLSPLLPILRLKDPTARKSSAAGIDLVELALNHASPNQKGFFTLLNKQESSPESMAPERQRWIWEKTLEWTSITWP